MGQTRRKNNKARGRTQSQRIASQQKDAVMGEVRSAPSGIQKKQASTKKKDYKKQLKSIIENKIKINIPKPNFESLIAGELYKFFYREQFGLYQMFHSLREDFRGRRIPSYMFKTPKYNEIMKLLEDHQKKIQSDLEEIKKLPDEFARIDIPNVEDDLSNLFTSLASF